MDRIPILNVYYLLCYAWRHVQERDTRRLASLADLSTVQDLLGKVLATAIEPELTGDDDPAHDPSTNALIRHYRRTRA